MKKKNPIPNSKPFNSETAREAQKKSVAAKRSNGRIREYLLTIAARPNNEIEEGVDNEFAIAIGIVRRALQGDAKAVEQFVQFTGQNIIKVEANERVTPALDLSSMGGESQDDDTH